MDIYYDSLTEAEWFSNLNSAFSFDCNEYHPIESRGKNPVIVDKLVQYDRPDIIVINHGLPVLVLEKTQEVPTGHNVGQRFARLVRAVELGVPAIYYFPFDARKHGENANICNLNIRLIDAAEKMFKIHGTPLLCVDWKTDAEGEIIIDGSESRELSAILKDYVDSGYSKKCEAFMDQLLKMDDEYCDRLAIRKSYGELPNSVKCIETTKFCKEYQINDVSSEFLNRLYTYKYTIDMSPDKCKRQDPYTGTAFIYDYMVCRNGPNVEDKCANLVLYFPRITIELWKKLNPDDLKTKSCNWYLTANMLLFSDGYMELR